ncbi:MFS transporter [Pseudonocardia kunmingensis]|uniref:Putative MFS family arabinose efflux permease n=1 Tax=Pseudonocardia kunmingensis TaxID=630975 RepID=A0A543E487_9PSEU|nr:MFS transporter [Pseudonocardia kunmingensis]TQM16269.1 putative MFS family arabinose efflux permease [Pseudonocardia kunmingensis]
MPELGTLRRLVVPVLLPAAVFGVGQGAAVPVVALQARELGASVGVAGLVVALLGLGQVLGDLPAGRIVARIGERAAVLLGSAVGAAGAALGLLSWSPVVLGIGVGLFGVASSVWGLARQAYIIETVPLAQRARTLSAMAGLSRLGTLLGPFLGAGVVLLLGPRGGFLVQLAAVLVAAALMAAMPRVKADRRAAGPTRTLRAVLAEHHRVLRTLGTGALLLGAARASRTAVLPLWADHIGLDAATTSLLFGVGAAVDVALSYPAGRWMDLRGRRPVAVASLVAFAAAHVVLPFAGGLVALGVVAVLMGLANGLSNGVIMTLGADAAPVQGRAEFLGAFRLCHDIGMLTGPLLLAGVAAAATLSAGSVALGAVSTLGAAGMARWVPRRGAASG